MGLSPFSRSSFDSSSNPKEQVVRVVVEHKYPKKRLPNPDPYNYEIVKYEEIGRHLLVEVEYPDCTNYEGRKILLFMNTTLKQLKKQAAIDPHFSDNKKKLSPFARFEPTNDGWDVATRLLDWVIG